MGSKKYTLIGAALGLTAFLGIALLPSLLYGGYAGVLLASGLFGTPISATIWVRAIILFGMVLGVLSVAALFTVAGAAIGAGTFVILEHGQKKTLARQTDQ